MPRSIVRRVRFPRRFALPALLLALGLQVACGGGVTDPSQPLPPPGGGTPDAGTTANLRWSDPATWGGAVPAAGSEVVIPADRRVLLDVSPPELKRLTIRGALVFGDTDLELRAGNILVEAQGVLQIGTETRPHLRRAVITLTDADLATSTPPFGQKVLGVRGTLDLHGETRTPWLRLARTAPAGATALELERNPGWRVGDRLVVASTDFDPLQAEEVVVTAVSGSTVTLEAPLRFAHFGDRQTIAGVTLDERAEVGLLSRNILVRSADPVANGLGGHAMFLPGSTIRVEGAEFHQLGQRAQVARYPIHWHMMGDVTGHYVRHVSVWRTFNRCITVHGTNRVILEGNVCHDHAGHGYFLEDGGETGNVFRGNLGLTTRRPATADQILGSDQRPSTYWITNPDNTFVDNVAAGSAGIGFWIALPAAPTGLSTGQQAWPRRTPLRRFDGNVAHSNRDVALNVDHGPRPDGTTETTSWTARTVPSDPNSAVVETVIRRFTAWKSREGIWARGSRHTFEAPLLADNQLGATFASSESFIRGGTVIGESGNTAGTPLPSSGFHLGFVFYDGRVGVDDVTFANFRSSGSRTAGALGMKLNNSFSMDPFSFAARARFVDAVPVAVQTPAADRDGNKMAVFLDSTGTVTGTAGRSVTSTTPILQTNDCTARPDWNALVCGGRYVNLRVDADPSNENVTPLALTRDDGVGVTLTGIGNSSTTTTGTDAHMNLPSARRYRVTWPGSTAPQRPRFLFTRAAVGDWVRLEVPYPTGNVLVIRNYNRNQPLAAAATLTELEASTGDRFWYDGTTGLLHLKLVATSANGYANALFVEPRP
jgi:cell migration-inducing and hyaluronan-binding protein